MKQILAAVSKAMAGIGKITKDGNNQHGRYKFASIDAFLAAVNPICAENGLVILMTEGEREDFERKGQSGQSDWMRASFEFTVYHISGETLPPAKRTVEVLRNGSQAYGSAQSYALKQFLRALLLIQTGDEDDADHQKQATGRVVTAPRQPRPAAGSVAQIDARIRAAQSLEELRGTWQSLPAELRKSAPVAAAKDRRRLELEPEPPVDLPEEDFSGMDDEQ